MCTGKCSKVIAIPLYVLAGVSIICNIIAFFPGWSTKYAQEDRDGNGDRITDEVKYMGGFIGGGLMCLIPAIHIHLTSSKGCCANRCGMFLSIGFAAAGVVGALYSLATAALVLANGPVCLFKAPGDKDASWGRPFFKNNGSYLGDSELWTTCEEPKDVVEFNIGLFATLLVAASVELVLCVIQMVNGLFGCICGTCGGKEEA
ncbi:transmembrane 4 L6 family member 4-like isoform X1 [Oncorhynchus mykiss]|nr:transmembrane 4 L6 family member 4-like isoform X1 [Oncorhynchus mykiss]